MADDIKRITNKSRVQVPKGERPRFIRPVERQRMRPWLIEHLDKNDIPGLVWQNRREKVFRISWKHAANQCFNMQKDTNLFERWAIHTGRHYDSDHKRWKANFRCALNSLPDVIENKEQGIKKGNNAFKVYRFLDERITKTVRDVKVRRRKETEEIYMKSDTEEEDEEGSMTDHSYAEYIDQTCEVTAVGGLPKLEQLYTHTSGVDLLLQADSKDKVKPIFDTDEVSNIQEILAAASASLAAGNAAISLKQVSIEQLTHLGEVSRMKLEVKGSTQQDICGVRFVYLCGWCEKVFPSKVELFQHFLILHQDKLLSRELYPPIQGEELASTNQRLQKEIADLEKEVLSGMNKQQTTDGGEVIEDGVVVDMSASNDMTSQEMYTDTALDLTIQAKNPIKEETALDLSINTARKQQKQQKQVGFKTPVKRKRGGSLEIDYTVKFGNYGIAGKPRTKRQMSLHSRKKEEEEERLQKMNAEKQHSMEDLVHAQILMSLKTAASEDAEIESDEQAEEADKEKIEKDKEEKKPKSKKGGRKAKVTVSKEVIKTEGIGEHLDQVIEDVAKVKNEDSVEGGDDEEEKDFEGKAGSESKLKAYKCGLCLKKFDDPDLLGKHVNTHKPPYLCLKCTKLFDTKHDFMVHSRSHVASYTRSMFDCGICKLGFSSEFGIKVHLNVHKDVKLKTVYKPGGGVMYVKDEEILFPWSKKKTVRKMIGMNKMLMAQQDVAEEELGSQRLDHKYSSKQEAGFPITIEVKDSTDDDESDYFVVELADSDSVHDVDREQYVVDEEDEEEGESGDEGEGTIDAHAALGSALKKRIKGSKTADVTEEVTEDGESHLMSVGDKEEKVLIEKKERKKKTTLLGQDESSFELLEANTSEEMSVLTGVKVTKNDGSSGVGLSGTSKQKKKSVASKTVVVLSGHGKSVETNMDSEMKIEDLIAEDTPDDTGDAQAEQNDDIDGCIGTKTPKLEDLMSDVEKVQANMPNFSKIRQKPAEDDIVKTEKTNEKAGTVYCGICNDKLRLDEIQEHLDNHEKVSDKDRNRVCMICKGMVADRDLHDHMQAHFQRKPTTATDSGTKDDVKMFVCNLCNLSFSSVYHLKEHVGKHLQPRKDGSLNVKKRLKRKLEEFPDDDNGVIMEKRRNDEEVECGEVGTVLSSSVCKGMVQLSNTEGDTKKTSILAAALNSAPKYAVSYASKHQLAHHGIDTSSQKRKISTSTPAKGPQQPTKSNFVTTYIKSSDTSIKDGTASKPDDRMKDVVNLPMFFLNSSSGQETSKASVPFVLMRSDNSDNRNLMQALNMSPELQSALAASGSHCLNVVIPPSDFSSTSSPTGGTVTSLLDSTAQGQRVVLTSGDGKSGKMSSTEKNSQGTSALKAGVKGQVKSDSACGKPRQDSDTVKKLRTTAMTVETVKPELAQTSTIVTSDVTKLTGSTSDSGSAISSQVTHLICSSPSMVSPAAVIATSLSSLHTSQVGSSLIHGSPAGITSLTSSNQSAGIITSIGHSLVGNSGAHVILLNQFGQPGSSGQIDQTGSLSLTPAQLQQLRMLNTSASGIQTGLNQQQILLVKPGDLRNPLQKGVTLQLAGKSGLDSQQNQQPMISNIPQGANALYPLQNFLIQSSSIARSSPGVDQQSSLLNQSQPLLTVLSSPIDNLILPSSNPVSVLASSTNIGTQGITSTNTSNTASSSIPQNMVNLMLTRFIQPQNQQNPSTTFTSSTATTFPSTTMAKAVGNTALTLGSVATGTPVLTTGQKPTFNLVFAPNTSPTPTPSISGAFSTISQTASIPGSNLTSLSSSTNPTQSVCLKLVCNVCNVKLDSLELMSNHICNIQKHPGSGNLGTTSVAQSVTLSTSLTTSSSLSAASAGGSGKNVEMKVFPCNKCKKTFSSAKLFNTHKCVTSLETPIRSGSYFSCPLCRLVFQFEAEFLIHVEQSHPGHVFSCNSCTDVFSNSNDIELHMMVEHPLECNICKYRCKSDVDMRTHILNHPHFTKSKNISLQCEKCLVGFVSLKAFLNHIRFLHPDDPFTSRIKEKTSETFLMHKCTVCACAFRSKQLLFAHIEKEHYRSLVYHCGACQDRSVAYKLPQALLSHMEQQHPGNATATLDLTFCHDCCLVFPNQSSHSQHLPSCLNKSASSSDAEKGKGKGKKSSPKTQQTSQQRQSSPKTRQTSQQRQQKSPPSTAQLQISVKENNKRSSDGTIDDDHPLNKDAVIPKKVLTEKSGEKKKIEAVIAKVEPLTSGRADDKECSLPGNMAGSGSISCSQCHQNFKTPYQLKQHKVMRHMIPRNRTSTSYYQHVVDNLKRPKLFDCLICGKTFDLQAALRWHMRVHSKVKKFSCSREGCQLKFRTKQALQIHLRKCNGIVRSGTERDGGEGMMGGVVEGMMGRVVEGNTAGAEITIGYMDAKKSVDINMMSGGFADSGRILVSSGSKVSEESTASGSGLLFDAQGQVLRPIQCKLCSVKCSSVNSLRQHLIQQHQEQCLKCVDCGGIFLGNSALSEHRTECAITGVLKQPKKKIGRPKKLFGCAVCHKSFFKVMKLTKHMWWHDQEQREGRVEIVSSSETQDEKSEFISAASTSKPQGKAAKHYMCCLCRETFNNSTVLYQHVKAHTDAKEPESPAKNRLSGKSAEGLMSEGVDLTQIHLSCDSTEHQTTNADKSIVSQKNVFICEICSKEVSYDTDRLCESLVNHQCFQ